MQAPHFQPSSPDPSTLMAEGEKNALLKSLTLREKDLG